MSVVYDELMVCNICGEELPAYAGSWHGGDEWWCDQCTADAAKEEK